VTTRRDFLGNASALAVLGLGDVSAARWVPRAPAALHDSFPRHDPVAVEAIVRVAHIDVAEVRKLVELQPALARASWDWGFGDWETGLGAAAHSGKRDIAELLLAHGARPTIVSAAMMGQVDVVRAFISAQPGVAAILGPHGLTLLHHARAGGTDAEAVRSYLETVPDANKPLRGQPLDAQQRAALVGRYAFGAGPRDFLDVDIRSDQLGIQRPETNRRFLIHTGNLMFFPSGVPTVRIAFAVAAGKATELTVADPVVFLTARRVT
jgi:hypothetical protein